MKNPRFELHRRWERQYHCNKRGDHFEQGILVRHDYGGLDQKGLSWWDDVQFILGRRRIAVAWQHPRHVYHGLIEDAAMKAVQYLRAKIEGGMFDDAEKSYRKVGRSRKKIRNVAELRVLADLVRRILKGETTLQREFPRYIYGKAHWIADGLAQRAHHFVSHRIART